MQNFLQELQTLLYTLRDWLLLMLLFTFFFFTCNVGEVTMFGRSGPFFVITSDSFAATWFQHLVATVVPADIPVIVTGPLTAFVAQVKLSIVLALLFTLPVLLYRLLQFLTPALYQHERKALYKVIAPTTILFIAGAYFSYRVIVPSTFYVLYGYTAPMGATAFLSIGEFISLTLALLLVGGLAFTLPAVMVLLTISGLVSSTFWWDRWRHAFITLLIISAIITPDGSGVSMVLLSVPTTGLYIVGALISTRMETGRAQRVDSMTISNQQ